MTVLETVCEYRAAWRASSWRVDAQGLRTRDSKGEAISISRVRKVHPLMYWMTQYAPMPGLNITCFIERVCNDVKS